MDRVDNDQNKEGECGGCGQLCLLPAPAIPTVILIAVRAANAICSRCRRRPQRGEKTDYQASVSCKCASTTAVAPVATTSKLYPRYGSPCSTCYIRQVRRVEDCNSFLAAKYFVPQLCLSVRFGW